MDDHAALLRVVHTVRNRWRLRVLLRGAGILLLGLVALLLVAGYAVDAARFDAGAVAFARTLAYLAAGALLWVLVRPAARRVSDEQAALYLEEREPRLAGRLISAVELGRRPERSTSPALVRRLLRSAVDGCGEVDHGRRVERAALKRSLATACGAAALGAGLWLAGPAYLERTSPLLLDPWRDAVTANPYRILVEPGDATVARGADLKVSARLEGFEAAGAVLAVRDVAAPGEGRPAAWRRWPMLREQDAHTLIVFDLDQPVEYSVTASGVRSEVYRVEVMELPYVRTLRLTYRFPAYAGLEPVTRTGPGDVAALTGTVVELEVTPTLPVAGGAIEIESDGEAGAPESAATPSTRPLRALAGGLLGGSFTVDRPGRYRILLDAGDDPHERVVASPDYLIDPLIDQPPSVTVVRPGRDVQATNLEEVAVEVHAGDDYGIRRLELAISVNGGEEQAVRLYSGTPGPGRPGRKQVTASHTLFLEELERPAEGDEPGGLLRPGDLVSYFARAVDGRREGQAVSDIYFLEIRPFDRNFRQADEGGMPGGQGMSGAELTARQRMIVAATFKLARRRPTAGGGLAGDGDLATVALAQGRLRQEVENLVEQLTSRGLAAGAGSPAADSPVTAMLDLLPQAAEEMAAAEQALGELRPERALAPEQKALQHLQRAEAAFTDVEVAQGQSGGGGGEIREQLAELFEQERDRLRNQYEQVQRGERRRRDEALDEVLEKLRELARRQQQENERARARQAGGDARAGSSGRSQRQLAEETEEAARKLERLARQQPQPALSLADVAETANRLRQAAAEMRRAAAERAGEARGSAALDRLRAARRQLEQGKSGRIARDAREAAERADRLHRQQQRMVERVEGLDPGDAEALDGIDRTKAVMGAEVGDLEADLDRLSRDARRDQPEASRRLEEAAGEIRERKIRAKILYSRGIVEQRSRDYARNFEQHIEGALADLAERLRSAAGAVGDSRQQRVERALEDARDAVVALESLAERLRAGGRQPRGQTQPGEPGGASQGGSASLPPRQLGRELGQRAADLERLRASLEREGIEAPDLDPVLGRLRALAAGGPHAGPELLSVLEAEVLRGLQELEFGLRRSLTPQDEARLLQAAGDDVPDGYEEMVDRYYRALAEGQQR